MKSTKPTYSTRSLLAAFCLLGFVGLTRADETTAAQDLSFEITNLKTPLTAYDFSAERLGGFERKKLTSNINVRGWKISNSLYFGQARVAKKWGLGFVLERDNTVYVLSHRGIQVSKRF